MGVGTRGVGTAVDYYSAGRASGERLRQFRPVGPACCDCLGANLPLGTPGWLHVHVVLADFPNDVGTIDQFDPDVAQVFRGHDDGYESMRPAVLADHCQLLAAAAEEDVHDVNLGARGEVFRATTDFLPAGAAFSFHDDVGHNAPGRAPRDFQPLALCEFDWAFPLLLLRPCAARDEAPNPGDDVHCADPPRDGVAMLPSLPRTNQASLR